MTLNTYLKLIGLSLTLLLTQFSLTQAATDCTQVTEIPQIECEALVDLYNSTNGPNWTNNTSWNETDMPCGWERIGCSNGHVIMLNLYVNKLKGSIPNSLGNLSHLQEIYLNSNYLSGFIPDSLGNLSSLQILWLDNNQLSGTIPNSLGNLNNLQWLCLDRNQLSGFIPNSLGNLSVLQHLTLDDNQLSGIIPDSLGNLSRLQRLDLSDNQLSGSIPDSLGNLSRLQGLFLSSNQLRNSIPNSLSNLSELTTLWLFANELCGDIPSSLMNLKLWVLDLDSNHLTASDPDLINWLNKLNPTWASTQTPCPQSQTCLVYALNDGGLNDTQFFTINPDENFKVSPLGNPYPGHDIEDLDIHPQTQELYAASGDNPDVGYEKGYIYRVNKDNGELTPICGTGLGEVSAMSFHPTEKKLWVWADGKGLFVIDLDQIVNGICHRTKILSHPAKVESITWDNEGKIIYGAAGTALYKYFYDTGKVEKACDSFPSEVEALDMLADGSLLFALHQARDTRIHSFDITTCSVLDTVPIETPYSDIEGITWACDSK
ncbi:hypothetical protein THII_3183 [Thioploca ingrica]|uniref:Leucine-rich repeat-containing N-terminal plant-type domain-containing protein n=1 Tax=Thioploca ingrica TaxID=40754 RepID=A0A090APN4_9GAMM|nr:hypothetical protein THII_3183 [Thioploca ingrica]